MGWTVVAGCCVAIGLAACGGGTGDKPAQDENSYAPPRRAATFPDNPNDWTCRDFDEADADRLAVVINELVGTGQLRGQRADLERRIRERCREVSPDYQPAVEAVDATAAAVAKKAAEEAEQSAPADIPSSGGGGGVEPPPDPQRSDDQGADSEPPHAPPAGETQSGQGRGDESPGSGGHVEPPPH